ncbi:hypothetical protein KOW79_002638 [Hemibagrus wyckioides]|uniref:Uncharacterized protein n=1 Tax=Hemibagrus wyckioides TaxID=337641 RepID=A0A9D3P523_9TELE|nr:hypothetical protein KOW79_002638 [Hemibagrus wyckioides]
MAICQAQMSYPRNSCIGSGQREIAFLIQRTCQRPPCHTRNTAESANFFLKVNNLIGGVRGEEARRRLAGGEAPSRFALAESLLKSGKV